MCIHEYDIIIHSMYVQNAKKFIPLAIGINRTAIYNCDIHWCSVRYVGLSFASKI